MKKVELRNKILIILEPNLAIDSIVNGSNYTHFFLHLNLQNTTKTIEHRLYKANTVSFLLFIATGKLSLKKKEFDTLQ